MVTNPGCVPGVPARTYASPSSLAVAAASVSRSHTTSRWSETNPIGLTTTAVTPCPARSRRWSLMSGSSHGTCGGPDLLCQTRSYGRSGAAPAATSRAVSASWAW